MRQKLQAHADANYCKIGLSTIEKKNWALVRLTARIVQSFAESSEAAETAFSVLRNFELDDSAPISRILDNDLNVSVLICGWENMLF